MKEIKIGVVLVNWNDSQNTIQALESIKQTKLINLRVVVVDNHSTPKEIANLQNYLDKNIKLIINSKNYGLPFAVNKGIEYLLKSHSITHIMWLNSEGRLAENFFHELIPFVRKNKNLGIIATKNTYKTDSNQLIPVYGMYISKSGYGNVVIHKNEPISSPQGTISVYSKEALEAVRINNEYLPSRFFLYAEDLDLGIRIQLAGYKWKLADRVVSYHTGWAFGKESSNSAVYYLHRNILWFTLRCFPDKLLLKNLIFILFAHILSLLYYSVIKRKPSVIIKAKWDSIMGIPTAWKERRLIQKNTKILNSEFEKILSNRLIH